MLLQLSLCVLTVIQLTSSQPTYDVTQHENDVNSCGRNDEVLSALAQLQRDVDQLKVAIRRTDVKGKMIKYHRQVGMQQPRQPLQ